jgi:hypothetical protein
MPDHVVSAAHLGIGLVMGIIGSYTWIQADNKTIWEQLLVGLLVLVAGVNFFLGLKGIFVDGQKRETSIPAGPVKWYSKQGLWALLLVYLGAVFYSMAAFYHLALPKWTFLRAFMIAVPLILIEYHFMIRGNHMVYDVLQWNATQVAFVTLIFYFINTWILNKFVFKRKFVWWRETLALGLLAAAFGVLGAGSKK